MEKMKITFNGCDDPKAFLEKKAAAQAEEDRVRKPRQSAREYFQAVEEGRAAPVHRMYWDREYESWDAYKEAAIAIEDRRRRNADMGHRFENMSVRAVLAVMPDIVAKGPEPDDAVSGFAGRLEREFDVKLAADYRTYLSACGRVSVCGLEHTGMDPSSDCDLVSAVKELREGFDMPGGYYPLSAVDSAKTSIIAFLQDADGYVYLLDRDGVVEPAYESLSAYLAGVWYAMEEGLI